MHLSAQYLIRILPACFFRTLRAPVGWNDGQSVEQNGLKIILITLDSGSEQVIKRLRNGLEARFNAEVSVFHKELAPCAFLDSWRNQFKSSAIIEWLENGLRQCMPRQATSRALAITGMDLYVPMLTFVFGEARLNGRCAVASSYRLDNKLYGLPHDSAILSERLLKECIHELGHTFGLIHCHNPKCVMKSSTCVEQIDLKSSLFCDRCSDKLSCRDDSPRNAALKA